MDALADHLRSNSERAGNLEDQLAHRRSGVDVLLIELEVDATRFQVLNRVEEVDQASSYAVNSPGHDDVEHRPNNASLRPVGGCDGPGEAL
jgi:hypothetical protein